MLITRSKWEIYWPAGPLKDKRIHWPIKPRPALGGVEGHSESLPDRPIRAMAPSPLPPSPPVEYPSLPTPTIPRPMLPPWAGHNEVTRQHARVMHAFMPFVTNADTVETSWLTENRSIDATENPLRQYHGSTSHGGEWKVHVDMGSTSSGALEGRIVWSGLRSTSQSSGSELDPKLKREPHRQSELDGMTGQEDGVALAHDLPTGPGKFHVPDPTGRGWLNLACLFLAVRFPSFPTQYSSTSPSAVLIKPRQPLDPDINAHYLQYIFGHVSTFFILH